MLNHRMFWSHRLSWPTCSVWPHSVWGRKHCRRRRWSCRYGVHGTGLETGKHGTCSGSLRRVAVTTKNACALNIKIYYNYHRITFILYLLRRNLHKCYEHQHCHKCTPIQSEVIKACLCIYEFESHACALRVYILWITEKLVKYKR